ncbi:superoxide dismutase [Kocuria coralli]|uniref:Superoxide dismutase [Cu-Zn] n=1 Tax=Kocuria coralli TaxID=1461025 RepID=A0A5J5KW64_9MICC|nr:superoxide dismutase [Kocuria coralli]
MPTPAPYTNTSALSRPLPPGRLRLVALSLGAVLALSACANGDGADTATPEGDATSQSNGTTSEATQGGSAPLGTAALAGVDGGSVGEVRVVPTDGGVQIDADVENLEPGFYGFHVHQVGECEAESAAPDDPSDTGAFLSAGSHIPGEGGADHPGHAGDLPTLLVNEDGSGSMTVITDRLDESLLMDDDGSAIMIHADPDNFANIPERYASEGPDEDTTATGDAGDRLACGVIEAP